MKLVISRTACSEKVFSRTGFIRSVKSEIQVPIHFLDGVQRKVFNWTRILQQGGRLSPLLLVRKVYSTGFIFKKMHLGLFSLAHGRETSFFHLLKC